MKRKIAFVLLLALSIHAGYSQRKDFTVAVPSPNASSLGTYGEMPVSHFTGIPNISVPLYELKGSRLTLPISLSYHAGGLRPDNHPGWVGNGWSLLAGGSITRKPNGQIDEYHKAGTGKCGYFFNYSNLNDPSWSSSTRLQTSGPAYFNVDGIPQPQVFDSDTEPDEFSFSFLNYSGKFFLDQTGVWRVQCDKPLKVIVNYSDFVDPFIQSLSGWNIATNSVTKTFGKFTIIDEFGNKYIFGSTDTYNTAIEFSDVMIVHPTTGRGGSITANAWMLTKIISADGTEEINLSYERGPLTSVISYGQENTAIDASGGGFMSMDPPCTYSTHNYFGLNGTVIFPVYLTSISMPSRNILIDFTEKSKSDELVYKWNGSNIDAYGKVWLDAGAINPGQGAPFEFPSFYVDLTSPIVPYFSNHAMPTNRWERFIWLRLDAIYVRNTSTSSVIKQFDLYYNNDVNKRLQLNLVRLKDKNNQVIGNYSFGYNLTSLPGYLTIFGDHWGFNNNSGSGSMLPGAGGSGSQDYLTIRAPDPTGVQTQAEILTSITYPTGGSTSFIYEPNKYSQAVVRSSGTGVDPISATGVAGGLRIRQVNHTDNLGNTQSTQYFYVFGYTAGANPDLLTPSGILDSKPQYTFNCTGVDNSGYAIYYQSTSTHSILPLTTNSSGTHIGYSEVIESRSDGSYTIFKYSNQDNTLFRDQVCIASHNKWALGYSPVISAAYKRGKLLEKLEKDNLGNPIAEEIMTYDNVGPWGVAVNSLYGLGFNTCPNVGSYRGVNVRIAYQHSIQSFLPVNIVNKVYPLGVSGTVLTTTKFILYDEYKNVAYFQTTDSKGLLSTTSFKYPHFFSNGQPDNPYQRMVEMNNVAVPIEKTVTNGNDVYLKTRELNTYKLYGENKVYQDAYYSYESATPELLQAVPSVVYNYGGEFTIDGRSKLQNRIYYDAAGNPTTVETKDNISTAYIWNYNSKFPVAKVTNASNVYESGVSGNIPIQPSFNKFLNNTMYLTYYNTINVMRTGTVTYTFNYNNQYISGNNSTILSVNLVGISNPSFNLNSSVCARTIYYPSGCTNNSYSFNNVPPGVYSLNAIIVSVTGFNNYYGYTLSVNYPSYKYAVVPGNSSIAYTSFETTDHGNWTNVNPGAIISGQSPTGNKFYNISMQSVTTTNVVPASTYIVSYWGTGAPCAVSGTQNIKTGRTSNGWTYYEHKITGAGSVTVSGGGYIDELRMYPATAQMTTYTYDPIDGMTSECDANNNILYYEYDTYGRLYMVKDQDRNISKKICYNYLGTVVPCN